ncbi:MAG: TolC family protein, partial [Candidatus Didemnitutus sp.]|nr:TolC family protein [Candidatus Didemnitutus sp.]
MNARHFLAVLPLLASGLWAASPLTNDLALPERVVSGLDPILIQATSQSPRMLSRALELEIAENNRIMARASVLPSVGASYRRYESKDERADVAGTLPTSKIYYDISINQPLFHWGERRNLAKIGEIQKSIAAGNHAEAYRFLVQELRQKYLDLIVLRQQVNRERLFLNYAKGEVALGEDRLAKKVISDMEMFPIRLRGEQAQIAFERAEFNYAQTKDSFVRLTGLDRLEDAQLPDEIPRVGYSAQAF